MAKRPSSIDKLPEPVRELIGKLRRAGCSIDQILGKLHELDNADAQGVSRSALGRHVKSLDQVAAHIQETRAIANAVIDKIGDAPEGKSARLNIELMHSLLMRLMMGDGDLTPQDSYFLGTALQRLSQAQKIDVDRELKIRDQVKREMAEKAAAAVDQVAEKVAKAGGARLAPETLRAIREEIYGIR